MSAERGPERPTGPRPAAGYGSESYALRAGLQLMIADDYKPQHLPPIEATRVTAGPPAAYDVVTPFEPTIRDLTGAACAEIDDPNIFFPLEGSYRTSKDRDAARLRAARLCGGCPVRESCVDSALETRSLGTWGATTEAVRSMMRRKRARVALERAARGHHDGSTGGEAEG